MGSAYLRIGVLLQGYDSNCFTCRLKKRRKRCGIAKTVHGGETRAIRAARPEKMDELKEIGKLINIWIS